MPDEEPLDRATVQAMYDAWLGGAKKTDLEERYFGSRSANGKRFSTTVRRVLGHETEQRHPLAVENARLRRLLAEHGIDPGATA